jgi:hypothetical protein
MAPENLRSSCTVKSNHRTLGQIAGAKTRFGRGLRWLRPRRGRGVFCLGFQGYRSRTRSTPGYSLASLQLAEAIGQCTHAGWFDFGDSVLDSLLKGAGFDGLSPGLPSHCPIAALQCGSSGSQGSVEGSWNCDSFWLARFATGLALPVHSAWRTVIQGRQFSSMTLTGRACWPLWARWEEITGG